MKRKYLFWDFNLLNFIVVILCITCYLGRTQSLPEKMQNSYFLSYQNSGYNNTNSESADSGLTDDYKYWLASGIFLHPNAFASSSFSYNFSIGDYFYKVGALGRGGLLRKGAGKDGLRFEEYDISIGRRRMSEWFISGYFGGISYINGNIKRGVEPEPFRTIGIQTQVYGLFRFADEFGFGISIYGNLNSIRSFYGGEILFTMSNAK